VRFLVRETGITEEQARELIELIGNDPASLLREARLLKKRKRDPPSKPGCEPKRERLRQSVTTYAQARSNMVPMRGLLGGDVRRVTKQENLQFVQSMLREIRQGTDAEDEALLTYLIDMAFLEVSDRLRAGPWDGGTRAA
jgi:hypothetical protein